MLVVAAGGGVVVGYVSLGGSERHPAEREAAAARSVRTDVQLYSARFVIASRRALRADREFLSDYATFRAIWDEVSPEKPMMLKLISPASIDSESGALIPALNSPTNAIDAHNFGEFRPLLREIDTLIREGDGSGRGRLAGSRYEAEPAELGLDEPAP